MLYLSDIEGLIMKKIEKSLIKGRKKWINKESNK
jgi:hypothetical protein